MEKRLVAFLMASALVMIGWMFVTRAFMPPPPVAQPQVPKEDKQPGEKDGQPPRDVPGTADGTPVDGGPEQPPEVGPADPAEQPEPSADEMVAKQWVTLGSADSTAPYRMLVTLVNTGAAVERIELNSPRYLNLDDRRGYLGHLALKRPERGPGLLVNVVGAGTPAAAAVCATNGVPPGIQPGDLLLSAGKPPVVLVHPEDLARALERTRPGDTLPLTLRREVDGKPQTLAFSVKLARRPLEVVRPELSENRDRYGRPDPAKVGLPQDAHDLSFLMTLAEIGSGETAASIERDETEIRLLRSLHNSNWEVVRDPQDLDSVEFRLVLSDEELKRIGAAGPLEIVKRFRLARVPEDEQENRAFPAFHLDYELEIRNLGDTAQTLAYRQQGPTGLPLEGWWYSNKIHPDFGSAAGARDVIFSLDDGPHSGFNLVGCSQIVKQLKKHPDDPDKKLYRSENAATLRYAGGDAQYFSAVLIPDNTDPGAEGFVFPQATAFVVGDINPVNEKRSNVTYRLTSQPVTLEAGQSLKRKFEIFAGPKSPPLLEHYDLGDTIVYGWFFFIVKPILLPLLHFFYYITGGVSYGIAIIMLTILVRACMFPLSRKQVMGAQKMQELAPEIKKLTEKYKDDMQKKAAAQQELFRKHNYNPLSGCLLVFLQFPIFIGLYRSLSVDMELRQAPLIAGLQWCSNLSAPDMLWNWQNAFPQFFDFLVGPNGYLGPYLNILPLFTIGLFLMQQKMFMPPPTDDQQKMQQQVMTFMMIFMGVLFFRVPSGLCLYFIASSLWSLAERQLLPKAKKPSDQQLDPDQAKAEVAAKKAKKKKARQRR